MYFFRKFRLCIVFLFVWIFSETIGMLNALDSEVKALLDSYSGERNYSQICWLTAHNAFANKNDGWYYRQQNLGFQEQYNYGVRSFMIDLYWYASENARPYIAMCHEADSPSMPVLSTLTKMAVGDCPYTFLWKLGKPIKLQSFFEHVQQWLSENDKTIITLHFENHLPPISWIDKSGDTQKIDSRQEIESLLKTTDLIKYLLMPITQTACTEVHQWDTLGNMQKNNQRLIIFSDKCNGLVYTSSLRETQFNLSKYPRCEMRDDSNRDTQKIRPLFVFNHFYKTSLTGSYASENSYENIMKRVNLCSNFNEQFRLPNFIAVDFVEAGNNGGARRVVTELNHRPTSEFDTPTQQPVEEIPSHNTNTHSDL